MTTTREIDNLIACAAWNYACGYNDFRQDGPYVDPFEYVEYWKRSCAQLSRPSIQDAFKAFLAAQPCARCDGNEVITVAVGGPDYFGNYDTDEVACPECQGEEE